CVSDEPDWNPRFNIAPTQPIPVIRQNPKEPVRELSLVRWGLIPSWAKDPSAAPKMINARSETAATKPAFRDALKSCRCLIPADGFYEWSRTGNAKQPYCFEVNDGQLFAFAGIWDRWRDASGNTVETCSILTTTPNAVTSPVHDRMPAILDPNSYYLMARSMDEECGCGARSAETLRRSADAVLPHKQSDQQRGERRRSLFRARGTRPDSGSSLLIGCAVRPSEIGF